MAKTKHKHRHGLISGLDIGSTKMCCFIAKANDDGSIRLVGIGHQLSRGIKNGVVVDMEQAESSIRATVEAAEQMAGERVQGVSVNVSGGQPTSNSVTVEVAINGHEIGDQDIRRMLDYARNNGQADDRDLIHLIPVGFTIDGSEGVRDPRGMYGERLAVTVHLVGANASPVRNLASVVQRCHLDLDAKVVSGYASGLACLVEDEMTLGSTCVDMGGGTTTISVFRGGQLIHTAAIQIGGVHVTNDIARGLTTPLVSAERLKTLYGSTLPSASDDREILKVPLIGEDEDGATNQIPRSMLVQIIRPRMEETFEMVRSHLEQTGFDKVAGRRVVLTGGASQLQGVRDLAAMVLDKQVRLGRPIGFDSLPEATAGPAFSACAGLLRYTALHVAENPARATRPSDSPMRGPLGRVGGWLKQNF
jgi:cell division protein FtsA